MIIEDLKLRDLRKYINVGYFKVCKYLVHATAEQGGDNA